MVEIMQRGAFVSQTSPRLAAAEQLRIFHRKYYALVHYHFGIVLTLYVVPLYA